MLEDHIERLANEHLFPLQLQVFLAHHKHGYQFRTIAVRMDLSRSTVTDAYDGATRRLRKQGVKFTPDGNPYLEDVA